MKATAARALPSCLEAAPVKVATGAVAVLVTGAGGVVAGVVAMTGMVVAGAGIVEVVHSAQEVDCGTGGMEVVVTGTGGMVVVVVAGGGGAAEVVHSDHWLVVTGMAVVVSVQVVEVVVMGMTVVVLETQVPEDMVLPPVHVGVVVGTAVVHWLQ